MKLKYVNNAAGKIVGRIEEMERQHRAVDNFLLDKAREYGFVSDSEKTILSQIYEMRCIYAHPYEEAPSREKVMDAAASVVELVLSRPVKLRFGFGGQLLDSLLKVASFLDDYEPAVARFTKNIISRVDEDIYVWLLDKYWESLESISDDSSMSVFTRRGVWFCRILLTEVGTDILTSDEWHSRVGRFPKTLMSVCSDPLIFDGIGAPAQDSLVGSILDESDTQVNVLTYLESLSDMGVLSERQEDRFFDAISELRIRSALASGLRTKTCYEKLIDGLRSRNWYTQNPTVHVIASNGPEQSAELTEEQQVNLGRNILQAGEGSSTRAIEFLQTLSSEVASWPCGVVRGIALESFTNERNEIRFKARQLPSVLAAIDLIGSQQRVELIQEVSESVMSGTVEFYIRKDDYAKVTKLLSANAWAAPLLEALNSKIEFEE